MRGNAKEYVTFDERPTKQNKAEYSVEHVATAGHRCSGEFSEMRQKKLNELKSDLKSDRKKSILPKHKCLVQEKLRERHHQEHTKPLQTSNMGLVIHSARGIVVKNLKTEKVERPSIMIELTGNLIE